LTVPPPDDADEAARLEGNWLSLSCAVVASRIYTPDCPSVSIQQWIASVEHFGKQLARKDTRPIALELNAYRLALDRLGVSEKQMWSIGGCKPISESDGHIKKPSCCLLLCQICGLWLLALLVFLIALPLAIFWLPICLGAFIKHRMITVNGKLADTSGVVQRRRRNFDTLSEAKMLIGFQVYIVECICTCIVASFVVPLFYYEETWLTICIATAMFLFGTLFCLWLSLHLLECSTDIAREARRHGALFVAKASALEELQRKRNALKPRVQSLELEKLADVCQQIRLIEPAPSKNCCCRRRRDWHDTFSGQDLTFCGIHDTIDSQLPGTA